MAQGPLSLILVTIRITVRIQESEVRSPHLLDYRKSYQWIFMKFYGELECGLEINWLHFGDDPHHYPDPGVRSGSRSGFGKNCHVVNAQNRCPAKIIQQFYYAGVRRRYWVLLVTNITNTVLQLIRIMANHVWRDIFFYKNMRHSPTALSVTLRSRSYPILLRCMAFLLLLLSQCRLLAIGRILAAPKFI